MFYLIAVNQETTFAVTDAKPYVPVITLSTQDNAKLLQQLNSGIKRTINFFFSINIIMQHSKPKIHSHQAPTF